MLRQRATDGTNQKTLLSRRKRREKEKEREKERKRERETER